MSKRPSTILAARRGGGFNLTRPKWLLIPEAPRSAKRSFIRVKQRGLAPVLGHRPIGFVKLLPRGGNQDRYVSVHGHSFQSMLLETSHDE